VLCSGVVLGAGGKGAGGCGVVRAASPGRRSSKQVWGWGWWQAN
jgi:hypothetical protein